MDEYIKLQEAILRVQSKHSHFFESTCTTITDYVELTDGLLTVLKFKNGLPANIIDDVMLEIDK